MATVSFACQHCGSFKGLDRTYGRCVDCGKPFRAGTTGVHFKTKRSPPPNFFERFAGLGKIPVIPTITGTWPLGNLFPHEVQIGGVTFRRATWASPFDGASAQYREVTDYNAMHLVIYRNGSFVIDHLDEANPDQRHVLEHAVLDVPLATTIVCGIAGFGLGLVGGLLLMRSTP
jgi:hypothetical protein